ncbi:MAG: HlyD family secretion protein [Chitinophagales bacterium]
MRINLFYIAVLGVGAALFSLLKPSQETSVSFFGFAESNETEINYNYPVVVEQILVTPGQEVKQGDTLLQLTRRKSKETMDDQSFQMDELRAEDKVWRQKKESEIAELQLTKESKLSEINGEIKRVEKELIFKKSLSEGLQTIPSTESKFKPLEIELKELIAEKARLTQNYDLRLKGLKEELRIGNSPYHERIKRLTAELAFEESQKIQPIVVTAPSDGLIGTISCKEAEHISSYTTLLSFYEPHSGIIKGYVHENMTLQVQIGDEFRVSSLKDETIHYKGKVIGLGSRIVEIPMRLRKIPDFKTYGREVLVEITKENDFLQKEKVRLGRELYNFE